MQARAKALADVRRVETDIASMTLRAPADGVVTLFPNWRAGGIFSDNPPEFRPGDRAWSGATIAELPDFSTLQVSTRIDEVDRGRLQPSQTATIRVDAVPDREFQARVTQISALAKTDFTSWPPPRNFDVTLQLESKDPRLRPGMSGNGRIAVNRIPGSILVPPAAVFYPDRNHHGLRPVGLRFAPRPWWWVPANEEQLPSPPDWPRVEKVALKIPLRRKNHECAKDNPAFPVRGAAGGRRRRNDVGDQAPAPGKASVPTIRVARGNLDLKIYTSGELRAGKSAMMVAPSVGSSLHLIFLAKTGTHVKPGELVIDFDPSDQEHNLEMASSDLKEAEQSIAKAKADASVQESQDKVDLLKAEFDVRRAEMDVSKKDLVSAIDAKKNLLALDEARRRLSQLKEDIPSHAASNQADIAVAEEKLAKARLSMELAQKNIQNMHVRAPIDGLVAVQENRQTMFYFTGMRLPEYREGDEVQPGSFVAQILDVEQMELQGKVAEIDRANLSPGEPAEIEIYAFPHQKISGKVKDVAGTALQNTFFSDSGSSKFGVVIALDHPDPQLRPGLSGEVAISAGEMKDVLYLPPQAIFAKNGNPVVYVRKGNDFVPQKIKITRRSETRIAVEGLAEGTEVALVNPEQETSKTSATAASSPALGGGPLMSAPATTLAPPAASGPLRPSLVALSAGISPGSGITSLAQAAHFSDHARHDLWRGGGGLHALDRRRRAAAGDGLHRTTRRAQSDRRGQGILRLAGKAKNPPDFPRPHLPGPARHPHQHRRH